MNEYTGLLFAKPSFIEGAARILDLGNTFTQYNSIASPELADMSAMRSDWQSVGEDLRQVMVRFAAQYELQVDAAPGDENKG